MYSHKRGMVLRMQPMSNKRESEIASVERTGIRDGQVASLQFKIQNSKFKIKNSKFKIKDNQWWVQAPTDCSRSVP